MKTWWVTHSGHLDTYFVTVSVVCWNHSPTRCEDKPVMQVYKYIASCSSMVTPFLDSLISFWLRISTSAENALMDMLRLVLMWSGCPDISSRTYPWPVRMDVWYGMCGAGEKSWLAITAIHARMMVKKIRSHLWREWRCMMASISLGTNCASRSLSMSMSMSMVISSWVLSASICYWFVIRKASCANIMCLLNLEFWILNHVWCVSKQDLTFFEQPGHECCRY